MGWNRRINKAILFGKLVIHNQLVSEAIETEAPCHQWAGGNTTKHRQPVAHFHFFLTMMKRSFSFVAKNAGQSGHSPPWPCKNCSAHPDLPIQVQRPLLTKPSDTAGWGGDSFLSCTIQLLLEPSLCRHSLPNHNCTNTAPVSPIQRNASASQTWLI